MNIEFINTAYTEDGLKLPMVHYNSENKDICVICIHGMCANFADNYFASVFGKTLVEQQIGFIYEYNRGHDLENDIVMRNGDFKRCGTMYEIFEDSIYDLDLAIKQAKELGYKRIILLGHSLGCNKVIYYYYKKKPEIIGIILASAPDMLGAHKLEEEDYQELLKEAKENIANNEGEKLLHKKVEDYMYVSSSTYYNWYNENSNLNNLPIIANPKSWPQIASIDVPILAFSGANEEDYYQQLELIKKKAIGCQNFTGRIIEDTNHTYNHKEQITANLIKDWIKNNF